LTSEPNRITKEVKQKWRELGPVNLHELIEKNCSLEEGDKM